MIRFREAYERVAKSAQFQRTFGATKIEQFRFLVFAQHFPTVAAASAVGSYGASSGPSLQQFPNGAIVLGITASAIQAQTAANSYQYGPSQTPGRRDLFGLSFQYSGEESLTNGLVAADALLGSGLDTIFPAKELVFGTQGGIMCSVASLTVAPALAVTVAYHCMVPSRG